MTYPKAGHYEIVGELGRGGMGVVYKARDPKLERFVALKFLPASMTLDSRSRERFVREARAAAGIEHPNICTIHEIGETEDQATYIVMAHYGGSSLQALLGKGPLPVTQALEIATQVADGLDAAHERGIVHRDVKPGNILVTDTGQVKLVDFGLAKLNGSMALTRAGTILGTPAYMAPEQIRGDEVDGRADVWSLGVVLYEMLTGKSPFKRPEFQQTVYAVLQHEITSDKASLTVVPSQIEPIVVAALAKEAGRRIATMADLSARLKEVAGADSPGSFHPHQATVTMARQPSVQELKEHSIVVLPFRDMSPGQDNEHFSDGLTEEIITDLSRINALRVISRTSAMRLKGTDKDAPTIGRELNIRYVLEGSVRRAGDSFRIMAQLNDAQNDSQVWADKFNGTMDDVFEIQEQVSRAIVDALQLTLSSTGVRPAEKRPFDNLQAYESYLRARQEIWRWTADALDRALQHLNNAVDLVGANELLYAGIGYVHWQYANIGLATEDHLNQAEASTVRIFDLVPESPHGYRLLGLIQITRGLPAEGVRSLRHSLETNPNDPDALTWLVILYGWLGKPELARPLADRLLGIDPLNPVNHGLPGWLDFCQGRFAEAVPSYRKMNQLDPDNPAHRWFLIKILGYTGERGEAIALAEGLERDLPDNLFTWMCSLYKLALKGEQREALELAASDYAPVARTDAGHAWFVGVCHAILQQPDEAIDWLETAAKLGMTNYPLLAEHDPFLASLRDIPRFQSLLTRVKFDWEHFKA